MSEQKKTSPFCLTGFIFSLLSPVFCLGGLSLYFICSVRFFGGTHNKIVFLNCAIALGFVFMVLGLILSVIGIRSLKNGSGGKSLAVIGIVISVLMIIVYLILGSLVLHERTYRESPPTEAYTDHAN